MRALFFPPFFRSQRRPPSPFSPPFPLKKLLESRPSVNTRSLSPLPRCHNPPPPQVKEQAPFFFSLFVTNELNKSTLKPCAAEETACPGNVVAPPIKSRSFFVEEISPAPLSRMARLPKVSLPPCRHLAHARSDFSSPFLSLPPRSYPIPSPSPHEETPFFPAFLNFPPFLLQRGKFFLNPSLRPKPPHLSPLTNEQSHLISR